mmetsp:Transcript_12345/g.24055  ORF Transcript_12345/g.24055 Transcript_12345/m.24055 type:complete len:567 (-) Transcript_12345:121-1821(-)
MIPGLEYEQEGENQSAGIGSSDPSRSPANSVHSVHMSPFQQQQQHAGGHHEDHLLRRRPNYHHHQQQQYGANGGYNNGSYNGGSNNNGYDHSKTYDADSQNSKYAKRTPAKLARKLDFFPKMESDFQVRTERGGQFSLVGYGIMAILILAEFLAWRRGNAESLEKVLVDTSLNKKMRVNLNITFPSLHCDDLHLDVIDVAGDSHLNIQDTLFKTRLNLNGMALRSKKIAMEANIKAEEDKRHRDAMAKNLPPDYCGPCYGAQESEGQCCNTCDDVVDAYKKRRWNDQAVVPLAEQCLREGRGRSEPKKMSKGEGCNLSGYMTINRVAGNFHIAMGEGVERDGRHIHQFLPEDRPNFNASHVVHELSFMDEEYGDIVGGIVATNGGKKRKGQRNNLPGERSMNGVTKVVTEDTGTTGLFQYFIKVVPTKYTGDILNDLGIPLSKDTEILETNRYFYTERFRPLIGEVHEEAILSGDPDRGTAGAHVGGKTGGTLHEKVEHHDTQNAVLPGVFFVYEIYPFAVEVTKNNIPLMHLLIRIMATVGGVFTVMSWIDGAMYSREKSSGHIR